MITSAIWYVWITSNDCCYLIGMFLLINSTNISKLLKSWHSFKKCKLIRLYLQEYYFYAPLRRTLSRTLSAHTSWAAEEPYWFWGQRSRSPGSNVPKPFPTNNLRTPWPNFLKLSPHIRPGQQRNPKWLWNWAQDIKWSQIFLLDIIKCCTL